MSQSEQFTWADYLELSENYLNDVEDDTSGNLREAKLRTVVSRTYYACYHKALKLLMDKRNFQFKKKKPRHQQVINEIFYIDKRIAERLDTLRENRVKADYYINEHFTFNKAKFILQEGKELYHQIREIYKSI